MNEAIGFIFLNFFHYIFFCWACLQHLRIRRPFYLFKRNRTLFKKIKKFFQNNFPREFLADWKMPKKPLNTA